ncbi:hypothetical protein BN946_scf184989.g30 [Trametes cinnabarina]|uniref:Major facilitator superfamily (MFS) profile domain-containing protein n=1 Tax=Pycnoporus cinnabarinus TaxID=5643 RepID=A0A060S911_PYCCI|nr:hypothetical protein BN946_scf184989.g30 [Trametes cinnabarina]
MDTPRSEKTQVVVSEDDKPGKYTEVRSAAGSVYEKGVPVEEVDLPPDGGRGWLVVFGCMIFSAATVGWGVIPGKLADRYGYKGTQPFLAAGGLVWTLSMLFGVFATKLWHWFMIMGVMQGIADALVYPLIVSNFEQPQWFLKYRALATGMVVAGSSIGGGISSLVFREMLTKLGLKKSLAIYTALDGALLFAAWFMISERRKPSERKEIIWVDRSFFSDPIFWSVGVCYFFTVFGYFSPIFFLPTFTKEKLPTMSDLLAALPVTMLNFSAAIGRTLIGFLADRMGPVNALWAVIMLSGLTQVLVWTFVSTYAGIMAFAIMYGFVCGCFLSLAPAVAAQLWGSGRLAGLSGLLLLFNLPGNSAGAPIGGAILNGSGGNWIAVSCYSGGLQVLGATCLLYDNHNQPFVHQRNAFVTA